MGWVKVGGGTGNKRRELRTQNGGDGCRGWVWVCGVWVGVWGVKHRQRNPGGQTSDHVAMIALGLWYQGWRSRAPPPGFGTILGKE